MRVLFVTTGLHPDSIGGMQRHSRFLIRGLADMGAKVEVIHPTSNGSNTHEDGGVVYHPLPWPRFRFPYHYVAEYRAYSRHVAQFIHATPSFDVVYGQGYALWAYLKGRRVPCVFNPHGLQPFQPFGPKEWIEGLPLRWIARYHVRLADAVISLGGRLTEILKERCGARADRLYEIPNAVDPRYIDTYSPSKEEPIPGAMLLIGRLTPDKGASVALEALTRVELEEARLFVIGDGPLLMSLRNRYKDPRIRFLGSISDDRELFRWYARAQCLVLPSLADGMPSVVLEAMAAGLPVVATEVGAVSELVGPENGFLVPSGDSVALAEAMTRLLRLSPTERHSMGRNGRAKVQTKFTWPQVARATYELLESLASHEELTGR